MAYTVPTVDPNPGRPHLIAHDYLVQCLSDVIDLRGPRVIKNQIARRALHCSLGNERSRENEEEMSPRRTKESEEPFLSLQARLARDKEEDRRRYHGPLGEA